MNITLERRGVICEPSGDPLECEGVLNPGGARLRDGSFMLYPRVVAAGNVSRVGRFALSPTAPGKPPRVAREGYALEPAAAYELRDEPGGYGCEDPRVTYVAALDRYLMLYAAYGPAGPRVALAISEDGRDFTRLGLMRFAPHLHQGADKDAAFFPEPMRSPAGVLSLAFYHRPMTHTAPPIRPVDVVDAILALPPGERECVRVAYVPLEPALANLDALRDVAESVVVIEPAATWGRVKIGAGTAPVRTRMGWLSLYHGVDILRDAARPNGAAVYTVGAALHDLAEPHRLLYRSAEPLCAPETPEERYGTVDDVVFPTALDYAGVMEDGTEAYDVYYGMADTRVGMMRMRIRI